MSPEQEQAIIDKRRREYDAAVRQRNLLRIEIESIGNRLVTAGRLLIERPHEIAGFTELSDAPNPFFDHITDTVRQWQQASKDAKRAKDDLASVGVHVD